MFLQFVGKDIFLNNYDYRSSDGWTGPARHLFQQEALKTGRIDNDALSELNTLTGVKPCNSHSHRFPDEDHKLGFHHRHPAAVGHSRTGEV